MEVADAMERTITSTEIWFVFMAQNYSAQPYEKVNPGPDFEPSACGVHWEQQTGSAQTRPALGVQLSPRRPFMECQPDKRAGTVC